MRRLLFLVLAACSAGPAPLRAPVVDWRVQIEADPLANAPAHVAGLLLQAELHVVRTPAAGVPIETTVRSIGAADGLPFRGAAPLAGVVALPDEAAADWHATAAAAATESLLVGTSQPFVVLAGATTRVDTGLREQPSLQLRSDGDAVRVQLLVPQADDQLPLRVAVQHRQAPDQGWFLPVTGERFAGYVLVLRRIGAANDAELRAAAAAARRVEIAATPSFVSDQHALVATSIGAQNRRGALLALAGAASETALLDTILTADESTLIAMSRAVSATPPTDAAAYSWTFAKSVWGTLVPQLQRDDLAPGMRACLLRHFGALGTDPLGLEGVLGAATDFASLWSAVQHENLLSLGDHRIAVRVRAQDWLVAHDAAVRGYDPMGTAAARREALRSALGATAPNEARR